VGQLSFTGLGLFVESDEAREGVTAFTEKRPPDFSPYRERASR
jgi:naphthoate synthase